MLLPGDDLSHIQGPVTEESILQHLHARYYQHQYQVTVSQYTQTTQCIPTPKTWAGPVLLSVKPPEIHSSTDPGTHPDTQSSTHHGTYSTTHPGTHTSTHTGTHSYTHPSAHFTQRELDRVVRRAVDNLYCTGMSQSILVSGVAGAGKTWTAMETLRRLYNMVGTHQTGSMEQLAAAVTVLEQLGTAATQQNNQSSRMVIIIILNYIYL